MIKRVNCARLVKMRHEYGREIVYLDLEDAWSFTVGDYTGPTCRDLDELETALKAARLGANWATVHNADRNWVEEVDRLRDIAAANATDAHEAHGELAEVLRELARARARVHMLEQELRLVQSKAVL